VDNLYTKMNNHKDFIIVLTGVGVGIFLEIIVVCITAVCITRRILTKHAKKQTILLDSVSLLHKAPFLSKLEM